MSEYTIGPRQQFEPLPTGDYQLTLKGCRETIEKEDSQFSKRGDHKIEWAFIVAVPGEDNQERKVRTRIVENYNEKSTLCKVLVGLGLITADEAMVKGLTFDPDQGIGRKCIGTIVRRQREDGKGMTDSIVSFSPGPFLAPGVSAGGDALKQRYEQLLRFAGLFDVPDTGIMVPAAMKQSMIDIGRQPLTENARKTLSQAVDVLLSFGGTDYSAKFAEVRTLRDGLIMLDAINKELDKFEEEGTPF